MTDAKPATRLIRLPGIRELEDRLMMDRHAADKDLYAFKAECAEALHKLFGISRSDTVYYAPDNYDELSADEQERIDLEYEEHEAHFVTEEMEWDEDKVKYLLTLGWDLRNDRGLELNITRYVCRVVEAVAKGIAGTAPDGDIVSLTKWTENLEQQVRNFQKQKGTRR